jgi:RimJ/RimL family protein N-acetyltransferase
VRLDLGVGVVRSWRIEDAPSLVRHANNPRIARNLRDAFPHPYAPADAEAFLRANVGATPEVNFAIAVDEEAIGGIGLRLGTDVERRSAELGYWLSEEYWGRGITTAAVRAVTAHAISAHGLTRVFATPFEGNAASCRVLEKAGYVLEGTLRRSVIKDGRVLDKHLYARYDAP